MSHAYTEDQLVEQPAIGLFAALGWQTISTKLGDSPHVFKIVRIPNKPDAAIEYFRLIDFEREGLEKYAFEGHQFNVRELLTGIAPVAPIQKSDDRRSDLHIYASDRTIIQVINGNDNVTSGSHNRTAQGISLPIAAQPKPFWQPLIAPIAVSVVTAVLLLMWIQGVEPKRIALFGLPLLAGGVVYLGILQREIAARTWARRNAAWCLAIAGASLMAPGARWWRCAYHRLMAVIPSGSKRGEDDLSDRRLRGPVVALRLP